MFGYIIIGIFILGCIVIGYVANLDWMMQNHPHYKGEDLFEEQLDSKEIHPK